MPERVPLIVQGRHWTMSLVVAERAREASPLALTVAVGLLFVIFVVLVAFVIFMIFVVPKTGRHECG